MTYEVIAKVHRLATAAEKYDGIVCTDMDGNILSEQHTDEEDDMDMESEKSRDQQPTVVGVEVTIDEATRDDSEETPVNMTNNNETTESENEEDIEANMQ